MSLRNRVKQGLDRVFEPLGHKLVRLDEYTPPKLNDWLNDHPADLLRWMIKARRALGRDCSFVQIGANDGIFNDPYRATILEYRLTGVLVEPLPKVYERLVVNYQGVDTVRFANVAIGATSGELELFRLVDKTGKFNLDDMTSFDRATSERLRSMYRFDAEIETCRVPCLTLDALVEREQLADLSLLFMDIEGGEWEILRTIDFSRIRPAYIQFEHTNLDEATAQKCYELLDEQGYGLCRQKTDTIAIHKDAFE